MMNQISPWLQNIFWISPHLAALITLGLLSRRLLANLRFLHLARHLASTTAIQHPRVSALVPARDEAASIVACVNSLLNQRYPDLEITVLDDDSTDGTGDILDTLAAHDPRLTVIHRKEAPPPGWNGKSYACHLLAEQATGDWLLFTDADTVHHPDSVQRGVNQALTLDVALLSAFPYQRVQSWSERILVSFILDFIPLVTVNYMALWRGQHARVAANGQYLLVHAAPYRALGGHASVKDALVDDFALASQFHSRGNPIALVDGGSMLACRMYHNAREVWSGFSKNLLGALTTTPLGWHAFWRAPLFAWLYACIFVLPFANLAFSEQRALAAIEIAWLLILRGLEIASLKRPTGEILTTPLAAWGVMALGISSLFCRLRHRSVAWKGRTYAA